MAAETSYNSKIKENVLAQQQEAFELEVERNEDMRARLMEEYDRKLSDDNLSDSDRAALLAELHAKIAAINDLIRYEENSQNQYLQDALSKRRFKKDKLRTVLTTMADDREKDENKL